MQTLNLETSATALLTRFVKTLDPGDATKVVTTSFQCDIKGVRLDASQSPLPVYRDVYTGKSYVRVAAVIPSNTDNVSLQMKADLEALNPIHYTAPDGGAATGWYVEAPDFDTPASAPAVEGAAGGIFSGSTQQ